MTYNKKLIEVAMPLEAINAASAREKSIRHGHPSTLHLWWARRPLAACRAVLFAQLVDDPSSHPETFPTEAEQQNERDRLFKIMEELVIWENSTNEHVLEKARREILRSCGEDLPSIYDPFSGGGSIPLEAQRLGLPTYGSDLNPVAVMIGKALVEIPPKFSGNPPVNPDADKNKSYKNAEGLAADVEYYGQWMRDEAEKRIGHLYPKATLPDGTEATVIAWLWARTVESPNPAFKGVHVPLVRSFALSTKKGKEAWIEPVIANDGNYHFDVMSRANGDKLVEGWKEGTQAARGPNFTCILSGDPIGGEHIKSEGRAGRMGSRLIAIVAEGKNGRQYLSADASNQLGATLPTIDLNGIEQPLPHDPRNFWTLPYGLDTFDKLFTDRQLVALTTFSDLVSEAQEMIYRDAKKAGLQEGDNLRSQGKGAIAYGQAVAIYLSFVVDRISDYHSSICSWNSVRELIRNTFGRQAIPMTWDYTEANIFSNSSGNWIGQLTWVVKSIQNSVHHNSINGKVVQHDASTLTYPKNTVISSDPPYYDNIGYADLSDFFYVWLRRNLKSIYPEIFSTMLVPKSEELVATPYRHGGKTEAEDFFMSGMTNVVSRMADQSSEAFPATIYYAFKAKEIKDEGITSTGWATFLEAIIASGYSVVATWPMRTEMASRMIASGTNALASSIVLVCRKRELAAGTITRGQFQRLLARELPDALGHLQSSAIAPVDMAQSAIGPGIGIFSRYDSVLEADDTPMSVKTALSLINETVDEILSEQEGDYDDWTRFAISWFSQYGEEAGPYGDAESIANARSISVDGVVQAGILTASGGKVRLFSRDELDADWAPETDDRLTVWEATQYLIRWHAEGGDDLAGDLMARLELKAMAEPAKALAYRLYKICEEKGLTTQAQAYNDLVQIWSDLKDKGRTQPAQQTELNV